MQHLILLLAIPGGASNSGDVLLQRILEGSLRGYGTLLIQPDPQHPTRSRGKRCRELLSMHLTFLKAASGARLGRDLCTTLMLPPGQSLTKSLVDAPRVAARLAYLGVMKLLGVRVVSLGRDFSSTSWMNRLQEVGFSHVAHRYTLRDAAALRRARSIGVRKAAWFPDLSWLAPTPQFPEASAERSSVVLSFRSDTDCGRRDDKLVSAILDYLNGFFDEARALGFKNFVLVQHANQDLGIMMQIERMYRGKYCLRREPTLISLANIPRVYGGAALVLSNRLHSLLLGLQWGAVPLAVIRSSKPEKVRNQFLDLNLSEHILDLAASRLGRGTIERALSRRSAVSEAVATYRVRAIRTARQTLAELFNSEGWRGAWEDKTDTRVLSQQLYGPTSSAPFAS